MFSSARKVYDEGARASLSSRDLEANALFKAARMLDACRQNWNAPDRPAKLEAALAYHQRLWTFFQTELSEPTHPIPAELRSWLLSLSVFLDKRVMELRAHPSAEGLEPLIRINREIGSGLSSNGEARPADPKAAA